MSLPFVPVSNIWKFLVEWKAPWLSKSVESNTETTTKKDKQQQQKQNVDQNLTLVWIPRNHCFHKYFIDILS